MPPPPRPHKVLYSQFVVRRADSEFRLQNTRLSGTGHVHWTVESACSKQWPVCNELVDPLSAGPLLFGSGTLLSASGILSRTHF